MNVRFIRYIPPGPDNDSYWGLVEFWLNGVTLQAEAFFSTERFKEGDDLDLDLRPHVWNAMEQWDQIFRGNKDQKKEIVSAGGRAYMAFGQVTSINPMTADCGALPLPVPLTSNDAAVIGEYISFMVLSFAAY